MTQSNIAKTSIKYLSQQNRCAGSDYHAEGKSDIIRRSSIYTICLILLTAAMFMLLSADVQAQAAESENQTAAEPVRPTVTITVDDIANLTSPVEYAYPAKVIAVDIADISAEAGGRIATMTVSLGDNVQQGARLATLDCTTIGLEKDAMVAQKASQAATVDLSRKQLNRFNELKSRAAGSQAQIDEATAAINAGSAQLDVLTANIAKIDYTLANCQIRAPFDGVITQVFVSKGQFISVGTPIVQLLSRDSQQIEVALRPDIIEELSDASRIYFDFRQQSTALHIQSIVPNISSMANAQRVRLSSDNPAELLNGANGQVRWTRGNALPAQFLQFKSGQLGVYVYHADKAMAEAFEFIPIDQANEGSSVIIDASIAPDTKIVTVGFQHIDSDYPKQVLPATLN